MSFVFQYGATPRRSAVAGCVGVSHWARWLCRLLAVWSVLTLLGAARALASEGSTPAGSATPGSVAQGSVAEGNPDQSAPMCAPDGSSVAAKDEIPEIDRGHFEALPCGAELWIPGWHLDEPELSWHAASVHDSQPSVPPPLASPPRIRHDAAYEVSVPFPERCQPLAAIFFRGEGLSQRRGHARGLYRPPVVRA